MKRKIVMAVLAVVFLLGIAGSIWALNAPQKRMVQIKSGGKVVCTLDLQTEPNRRFTVTAAGGSNVIEIKDGSIRVLSADCPDQTCVKMGWLSSAAMPVVCLPHGLVMEYIDADSGVDAISE